MAYIIERGILVTLETYDKFIEDVHKIRFIGKDKRQSPTFYKEIQQFLQHLICNVFLYAEDTDPDEPYTTFSPISSELGKSKLKFVFEQSKYLCCDRALELIAEVGIIKIKPHNYGKGLSRLFALSKAHLRGWFGDQKHAEYMQRTDRLIYLTTARRRRNLDSFTEESLIQKALSECRKPKHSVRHIMSRETQVYMREVYRNMSGLRINLDKLQAYQPLNEREALQKTMFLSHLVERGCRLVSSVPLVVEYWPEYNVADLGTRSFEKFGGFQTLKSTIKWHIFEGYNYDIESSQLTILRHELEKYGLKCVRLKKITKEKVMRRFDIDEGSAKTLIYSLIYSLGEVRKHRESEVFNILYNAYGYEVAVEKADSWREFIKPIRKKLKQLVEVYIGQGVNCPGRGLAIRNAVRQTYLVNPKKITQEDRRRILSHMLQGIESQATYQTILRNPGVCGSSEHDGLVSSEPVVWEHPYLKLKLKHQSVHEVRPVAAKRRATPITHF
ncbi:hypothetical protein [Serratia sp. (in: enterobacteria)]|uniref:hypothetical protein n=1 Tax=Serratia sp. (in: enterobacteria) TaxID=616 RepID=UPI00398949D1